MGLELSNTDKKNRAIFRTINYACCDCVTHCGADDFRNSEGVSEVSFLNAVLKVVFELKPASSPIASKV